MNFRKALSVAIPILAALTTAILLLVSIAHGADATSIHGITIEAPPADVFIPEPMPSGDTWDDIGLFLDPETQRIVFKKTEIAMGPSALDHNIPLQCGVPRMIATAPAEYGMRYGLAAYIPRGVWNLYGKVAIAGPSYAIYNVEVRQGHAEGGQPGIATENAQVVGGGIQSWAGPAHLPFSIPVTAHMIQYYGPYGTANEITVWVTATNCSGFGGAVLGSANGMGPNMITDFLIWRARR